MTEQREKTPLQRALDATAWASGWKTWPEDGDPHKALDTALKVVNIKPDIKRFDLACAAVEAAARKES